MSTEVGDDALDIALKVARALTSVGAEYFLGGSLAAGKVGALRDALGADFEVDTDMLRDAILHARCANVFYLPVVTKVDLFGRAYEPFDESEFSRRRSVVVRASGESLVIKSPEDTVLRKLLWYRQGGEISEKQWRDVISVLRISGETMDRAYLALWAARLDIAHLLERAQR